MSNTKAAPESARPQGPALLTTGTVCRTARRRARFITLVNLLVLVVMLGLSAAAFRYFQPPALTHPDFDPAALAGFPETLDQKRYGYSPLFVEEGYVVALCGVPANDGQTIQFNLTNPKHNTIWIRAQVLDEKDRVLGSTGVIRQGEYLPAISLDEPLTQQESTLTVRIIAYEPKDWTSRGNVSLKVKVQRDYQ